MLYKCMVTVFLVVLSSEVVAQSGSDIPITKDTILELVPPVPAKLSANMRKLFRHKPMLARVLSGSWLFHELHGTKQVPLSMDFNNLTSEDRRLFFKPFRKKLARAGIRVSRHQKGHRTMLLNFVVPFKGEWFIKASGLFNRRGTILSEMDSYKANKQLPQEQLDDFMQHYDGRTYHTLSRMVYWLRAKKAQKELGLNRICLPEKYLVHIPGRPTYADDTNYVVVVKKIHSKPILETDLLGDEQVVTQLAHVILRASLWDVFERNVRATKDNKVCLIDFEQPPYFKPSEFGKEAIIKKGIDGLNELISKYGEKAKKDVSHLQKLVTALFASYLASSTT